jgi:hypothetical protein
MVARMAKSSRLFSILYGIGAVGAPLAAAAAFAAGTLIALRTLVELPQVWQSLGIIDSLRDGLLERFARNTIINLQALMFLLGVFYLLFRLPFVSRSRNDIRTEIDDLGKLMALRVEEEPQAAVADADQSAATADADPGASVKGQSTKGGRKRPAAPQHKAGEPTKTAASAGDAPLSAHQQKVAAERVEALVASAEAAESASLAPVSFVVWVLPILGFLGTVIGVSNSMGPLEQLATGVSATKVAPDLLKHLRFPFDATFTGLVLLLPMMVVFTTLAANAKRWTAGLRVRAYSGSGDQATSGTKG